MKKKNVLNLIKFYTEKNDPAFRNEAVEIAKYFDSQNEYQLSEYIMSLLSNTNSFVPQINESDLQFFQKINIGNTSLPLPEKIKEDIVGIINAVNHNAGINKFLFEGYPGTGKTESVKQIARILDRELFIVNFESIIDSKLGQTVKNISEMFNEISSLKQPRKAIILFDEIDAIAIDRINSNDLREMGRATSAILKGLDSLNENILLIATTNLYSSFDKALTRRFDAIINFNRYSKEDLIEIAEIMLNEISLKFKNISKNTRLFKKIFNLMPSIPYPGELKNIIKSSVAFSKPDSEFDYLKRLFEFVDNNNAKNDIKKLQSLGFTLREIEIITGISKSQASRELKEENGDE